MSMVSSVKQKFIDTQCYLMLLTSIFFFLLCERLHSAGRKREADISIFMSFSSEEHKLFNSLEFVFSLFFLFLQTIECKLYRYRNDVQRCTEIVSETIKKLLEEAFHDEFQGAIY